MRDNITMKRKPKISVIIMTLNAEIFIVKMLDMLMAQSLLPDEIIVADSESTDSTVELAKGYDRVKILQIKRSEFDHGGSRDYALRQSVGEYILFFTQDAEIGDKIYIEKMVANFSDESVAMVCARQIAKSDAVPYEKLIREFNYPNERKVRTIKDIATLGIKAFYMSDVCSAYRRTAYLEIGGFEHPILTNEDMLIAAHAIKMGYKTVYDPSAFVFHSHNFSRKQEFKRNFDVAAFMAMYEDEFTGININREGLKLVKYVSTNLLEHLQFIQFIKFGLICCAKLMGNRKGGSYKNISKDRILSLTNCQQFWKQYKGETAQINQ